MNNKELAIVGVMASLLYYMEEIMRFTFFRNIHTCRSSNTIYKQVLNGTIKVEDAKKAIAKKIASITNSSQNYDFSAARKYHRILGKLAQIEVDTKNSNDSSVSGVINGNNDINNGSFRYEPKSHKNFRGIRCWVSAARNGKYLTNDSAKPYTDYVDSIMSVLTKKDNNIALLSYGKSVHNAIVIHHGNNKFSFISMYSDKNSNNGHEYIGEASQDEVKQAIANEMKINKDGLQEENLVYLHNLNVEKVNNYIVNNKDNYKFNIISNNCSRFAANALLAGVDSHSATFEHDRIWQMPANTLELAKEIAVRTEQ